MKKVQSLRCILTLCIFLSLTICSTVLASPYNGGQNPKETPKSFGDCSTRAQDFVIYEQYKEWEALNTDLIPSCDAYDLHKYETKYSEAYDDHQVKDNLVNGQGGYVSIERQGMEYLQEIKWTSSRHGVVSWLDVPHRHPFQGDRYDIDQVAPHAAVVRNWLATRHDRLIESANAILINGQGRAGGGRAISNRDGIASQIEVAESAKGRIQGEIRNLNPTYTAKKAALNANVSNRDAAARELEALISKGNTAVDPEVRLAGLIQAQAALTTANQALAGLTGDAKAIYDKFIGAKGAQRRKIRKNNQVWKTHVEELWEAKVTARRAVNSEITNLGYDPKKVKVADVMAAIRAAGDGSTEFEAEKSRLEDLIASYDRVIPGLSQEVERLGAQIEGLRARITEIDTRQGQLSEILSKYDHVTTLYSYMDQVDAYIPTAQSNKEVRVAGELELGKAQGVMNYTYTVYQWTQQNIERADSILSTLNSNPVYVDPDFIKAKDGLNNDFMIEIVQARNSGEEAARTDVYTLAATDGNNTGMVEGLDEAQGEMFGIIQRAQNEVIEQGKQDGKVAGESYNSLEDENPKFDPTAAKKGFDRGVTQGIKDAVRDSIDEKQYRTAFDTKQKELTVIDDLKKDSVDGLQALPADDILLKEATVKALIAITTLEKQSYLLAHPLLKEIFVYHYVEAYITGYKAYYNLYFERHRASTRLNQRIAELNRLKVVIEKTTTEPIEDAYQAIKELDYEGRSEIFNAAWRAALSGDKIDTTSGQAIYDLHRSEKERGVNLYTSNYNTQNTIWSEKTAYKKQRKIERDEQIGGYRQIETTRGTTDAQSLYTNNSVIEVVANSATIVESEKDGVYRPGETLAVTLKVRNFGNKASEAMPVKVTGFGVVDITRPSGSGQTVNLPVIPARSEITITQAIQAKVKSTAKNGEAFTIRVAIEKFPTINYTSENHNYAAEGVRIERELGQMTSSNFSQDINNEAKYPIMMSTDFDGVVLPQGQGSGNNKTVTVTLKNRSSKSVTADLTIGVDASKIQMVANPEQTTVPANDSKKVTYVIVGQKEAQFEETKMSIALAQNNVKYASGLSLDTVIIGRHKHNPDSKGLIISQDLAKGGGKYLYKSIMQDGKSLFDTYDLRNKVDGPLSNVAILNNYKGKTVNVLVDESLSGSFDGATLASLQNFANSGGMIIVWGPNISQSGIANYLPGANRVSVRSQSFNGAATGQHSLGKAGSSPSMSALASVYTIEKGAPAVPVLAGSGVNIGVVTLSAPNGVGSTSSVVRRAFLIGFSPKDIQTGGNEFMKNVIEQVTRQAADYNQRLTATKADALNNIDSLIAELKEEMILTYVTHGRKIQKVYENDKEGNKIYSALKSILPFNSERGVHPQKDAARILLGAQYPVFDTLAQSFWNYSQRTYYYQSFGSDDERGNKIKVKGGTFGGTVESWYQTWGKVKDYVSRVQPGGGNDSGGGSGGGTEPDTPQWDNEIDICIQETLDQKKSVTGCWKVLVHGNFCSRSGIGDDSWSRSDRNYVKGIYCN